MPTVRVKMNDTEFGNVMAVLDFWEKDPKLCGLIEILETPKEERDADIEIALLKVSGMITYDLWNKFCQESKMKIPFPGY